MVKGYVDSVVIAFMPGTEGGIEKLLPEFKGYPVEKYLERMDEAGIEKSILVASKSGGHYWAGRGIVEAWTVPYDGVKKVIGSHPERFAAVAGVDPTRGSEGLKELENAVEVLGFVGAHLYPHWWKLPPNHKKYYPIYAKCIELGIPIEMQVGLAFQPYLPSVARPMLLDEVATDFPDLKIIGIHTGWPWVEEMIAMMYKHENVYTATSTHYPTTSWKNPTGSISTPSIDSRLIDFINHGQCLGGSKGSGKVLMGTDFPIWDSKLMVDELRSLLTKEAMEKVCRDNAVKVFGLK